MLKRQLGTLFLVTCLILTTVPAVLGSTSIDKTDLTNSIAQKSAGAENGLLEGAWNNCDFSKPAGQWSADAKKFGGEHGIVDLVVIQAHANKLAYVPFPFEKKGYIYSDDEKDQVEPYLDTFEKDGRKVILSIQPSGADVTDLMDIILSRYGHHKNIIGINVDMEWKLTGNPHHLNDQERDACLSKIHSYNPEYRLFLTNFKDYTYFPHDAKDLVILYDGQGSQNDILKEYGKLASHFSSVGLYTGYDEDTPRTASSNSILAAAPNTKYILHSIDD
jgi:hypothetical protein